MILCVRLLMQLQMQSKDPSGSDDTLAVTSISPVCGRLLAITSWSPVCGDEHVCDYELVARITSWSPNDELVARMYAMTSRLQLRAGRPYYELVARVLAITSSYMLAVTSMSPGCGR